MAKTISLRDANQRFAAIVREVEGGAEYLVTRRGAPAVRIVPARPGKRVLTPEQEAALARTLDRIKKSRYRSPKGWRFNRDEAHER
ncbi:MAG: type II toxin-antitoxin system prevent-host-death family antitoxin [Alphaproteobacteria bacterium]|nr:type II toxin-antitoxin system prevent-host-death family antitoxin [Alphaproteobacteria bacterium]